MNRQFTKKAFRELLNRADAQRRAEGTPEHRHFRFHQRTRLWGDYLYAQDRWRFDAYYSDWLQEQKVDQHSPNNP